MTGSYPLRRKGRGYFPSPGWTGEYDWSGLTDFANLPRTINPKEGYLATANHRTVATGQAPHLTDSWYAPERYERIVERLQENPEQTLASTIDTQNDTVDLAALKLKRLLLEKMPLLQERINAMPEASGQSAEKSLKLLTEFDGRMAVDAPGAALYAIFLDSLTRHVFADELGQGQAWESFMAANAITYSAQQDHMLGREDSPFWDNVQTPEREDKWDIVVRTLAMSWQQGLDRGPFPAPGSTNTVNVAGYTIGEGFKVWNVPAMRLIVDFSLAEPLYLVNAGGQSGNPASRHYDDGIPLYLSGENRSLAFHAPVLVSQQFNRTLILQPADAASATQK